MFAKSSRPSTTENHGVSAAERLGELLPYAIAREVRLALEPLHPMFCADRAAISTLAQALAPAAPHPAQTVGVVIDQLLSDL